MDLFTAIVFSGLALAFGAFLVLGWLWRRRPAAEITDKRALAAAGAQALIEERDIPEMVEASNEYRRKRGRPEVTVEDVKARVGGEQAAILDEANKQLRARSTRAGGSARERRGF